MTKLLKIALVGRPNVGKSALFNAIAKRRIAIVDEAEGVTRDRLYATSELFGFPFEIIDTGGIDPRGKGEYSDHIVRQAEIAICEADSIIMVVDAQVGPQILDFEVAKILHRSKKPLTLAVNKIDAFNQQDKVFQFASLGITSMVAVSAQQSFHIAELIDTALQSFDKTAIPEVGPSYPKIAIIGRPNVGKSLLLNALAGSERSIVSPIAGTTRDSIDTEVIFNDQHYVFIDTAGIRRKQKEKEVVEKFAAMRTENAIERADVCLLLMDSQDGMTTEEKRIASQIEAAEKGCILLFNKWDLVKGFRMEHALRGIEEEVPFLKHCPKLFISAKSGRNLDKIFPLIHEVSEAYKRRISTGQRNKCLTLAMQQNHPSVIGGKRLRIYYLAQIGTEPPHFVLFVNHPKLMEDSYKRYLINTLRANFDFSGVPLTLTLRGKEEGKKRPHAAAQGTAPKHLDRDLPHSYHDDEDIEDEGEYGEPTEEMDS